MMTTKEFSEVTGVPYGTLRRWRSKFNGTDEGRQGVLMPAVVDERGRCFYSDAQIDFARRLHNPYYGQPTLFEEVTDMNDTAAPCVTVDDEFKQLIPPLADGERAQLEANILQDGILDPLIVWKGRNVIVDGHNRYELAQKHGLTFEITEIDFADRDAVKVWIIENQFGRRNVNSYSRGELALKLESTFVAQAKSNQGTRTDINFSSTLTESSKPIDTRAELAKIAGVSTGTMSKIKFLVEHATDEIKVALRTDKLTISSAFRGVKQGATTVEDVDRVKAYYTEPVTATVATEPARSADTIVAQAKSNQGMRTDINFSSTLTESSKQPTPAEAKDEPTNDDSGEVEVVGGVVNQICTGKVVGLVSVDDGEVESPTATPLDDSHADDQRTKDAPNHNHAAQVDGAVVEAQAVNQRARVEINNLLDRIARLIQVADEDALTVTRSTLTGIVQSLETKTPAEVDGQEVMSSN